MPPLRRLIPIAAIAVSCLGGAAFAAGRAGDERQEAEQKVAALKAKPAHKKLAAEPIDNAERALARARDARATGDHQRGALLESLAAEWADTGSDLVRAAEAEKQATELEKKAADTQTKAARAHALLEETIARRGRAQSTLKELDGGKAPPPATPPAAATPPANPGAATPPAKPAAPPDTKSAPKKDGSK